MILVLVFLFFLGVIIGSFLNVLGLRWNSGTTIGGRSFCVVCRKNLAWFELIPVVSFLGLNGKCRECKTRISWQYPLIELWTGLLYVTIYYAFDYSLDVFSVLSYLFLVSVFSIFVVIVIYDVRHKIIPDSLVYSSIIIGIIYRLINGGTTLDFLAGPLLFSFFALVWLVSKGRAMGFGDAKLALSIGIILGAPEGFSAFVLAFWIGSIVTLSVMAFSKLKLPLSKYEKGLTMKSEIPFAPFLIIGAWLSLVFNLDLFHVASF